MANKDKIVGGALINRLFKVKEIYWAKSDGVIELREIYWAKSEENIRIWEVYWARNEERKVYWMWLSRDCEQVIGLWKM